MGSPAEARARRGLPLVLLPWLVYVGVTVVAPAVNGAEAGEAYAEHAVITLGVSGVVLLLWLAASRTRPARRFGVREPDPRSPRATKPSGHP